MDRKEVKEWLLNNPGEAARVIDEVAYEHEIARLKAEVEEAKKELTRQAISYGKKMAKLENELNGLKEQLGLPVAAKKGKKTAPEQQPNSGPQKLSDRLAEEEARA
ncbi:MAG: hypothetical protein FJY85_13435 [Deltaproteobacteria bacterium]|nr:hypothetical protein [Chloroflexota bacterium]MBM3300944.1 hypothetical protein [Deltaproteobacteria bacterium]